MIDENERDFDKVRAKHKAEKAASNGHKDEQEEKKKQKQVEQILALAPKGDDLFRSPNGSTWADVINANGVRETWKIPSRNLALDLRRKFKKQHKTVPGREAINAAMDALEADADVQQEREVYTRIGSLDGDIYIDIGDKAWRAIKVTAAGWRIVSSPPVRFRRARGMLPLPVPKRGGSVEQLRKFLVFREGAEREGVEGGADFVRDADFVLYVNCILAALRHHAKYPVLCVNGEHGTAKSTATRIHRRLTDPNTTELRSLPSGERDAFIAATNSYVLPFDNVSKLSEWLSDTLCRLSTGGGFTTRELYTDDAEVLFDASRPIVLNGIGDAITKPDLASRTIFLTTQVIPDDKRQTESELFAEFEQEAQAILGALLDAVARGLRELPNVKLKRKPRMADFAVWANACESALPWKRGTFNKAYTENRRGVVAAMIDASPVATAVVELMDQPERASLPWTGIAMQLLRALSAVADEKVTKDRSWPRTPRGLGSHLRDAQAPLRQSGIIITFDDTNHKRGRLITIDRQETPEVPVQQSTPSTPSTSQQNQGKPSAQPSTAPRQLSTKQPNRPPQPSTEKPMRIQRKTPTVDGVDGVDCCLPTLRGEPPTSSSPTPPPADRAGSAAPKPAQPDGERPRGRCVQCNGEIDGTERFVEVMGEKVWLHSGCDRFYTGLPKYLTHNFNSGRPN
jgi:hypothetical protein